jgi:cytochrome c oxidase subunit 2
VSLLVSAPWSAQALEHSALHTAGFHADRIGVVWNTMLAVCGFMYALVLAFLIAAVIRARRPGGPETQRDATLMRTLALWMALVVVGLMGLTTTSYLIDRQIAQAAENPTLELRITAHQWWWDVEYLDDDPSRRFHTANEVHLAVNSSVHVSLVADDVIHSFWVPNLHGKRDLIPGRPGSVYLRPERIGVYRGQCAEFCGVQHAKMALDVFVDDGAAFEAWKTRQLATAPEPADATTARGREIFMSSACVMCHTISGTSASASVGPDLTHVASRRMLAAATVPNDRAHLFGWISDPQTIKPGNHMPYIGLTAEQLDPLVSYLETLQ